MSALVEIATQDLFESDEGLVLRASRLEQLEQAAHDAVVELRATAFSEDLESALGRLQHELDTRLPGLAQQISGVLQAMLEQQIQLARPAVRPSRDAAWKRFCG